MHHRYFLPKAAGLLLPLVLGCSTTDGVGSGSGDTGEPPAPPDPLPVPQGSACSDSTLGWSTQCEVLGQVSYENPLEPGVLLELEPFTGPTYACCEGNPSQADADAACVQRCEEQLCRLAEDIYDDIAHENGWNCTVGCQFDYQGCLAGIPVQQFPHPPFGDDYPHEVTVSCEATNVEPRHPDGTFEFIDSPENFFYDDPELCGLPPSLAGQDPLRVVIANAAREDAGTQAIATWWYGEDQGKVGSTDVEAELEYAVRSCEQAECLALTRVHASVPAGAYGGVAVQSADLTLVATTIEPKLDPSGGFEFPPGSLHFVLAASVGDLPLSITRTNATVTRGRISHGADLFELADLHLAFDDSDLGAELRLDLVGTHVNRAPRAAIRRLDTPIDCTAPVVFQAASVDPDDDPMQHYWWTPDGMFAASTAEIALSPGSHLIVLMTADHRGAHDATSLTYTRSCA